MRTSNALASLLVALGAQLWFCAASLAAGSPTPQIVIDVSEGRLLTLSGPAASVFLADPGIADVQVPQPNRIFIFGKKPGRTTLHALADNGQQIAAYEVVVHHASTAGAQQAVGARQGTGDVKITAEDNGVQLLGTATDANTASVAINDVKGFVGAGENVDASQLKVGGSQQVMLRVWIGEVDRTIQKDLSFNWNATALPGLGVLRFAMGRQAFPTSGAQNGSGILSLPTNGDIGSIVAGINVNGNGGNTVIDALASEGLITTLAEPTLIALSGEQASFLAGGQFPVPFASGLGTVSIQFQTYGVALSFVPTVLAPNRISLRVRPEVSEITTQGAVEENGFSIPGLTVRRASTTVELGSGQSFAIAGLLQTSETATIARYPGLGDLPVLGALFRSNNFQRGESELIIIVTPYLVKPVDDPNRLRLPTDGISPPTDIERIFRARMAVGTSSVAAAPGAPASNISVLTGPKLAGDAGFDLE